MCEENLTLHIVIFHKKHNARFFFLADTSTLVVNATRENKVTVPKNTTLTLSCGYYHKSEIERLMVATTYTKKKNAAVGFLRLLRNRKHYASSLTILYLIKSLVSLNSLNISQISYEISASLFHSSYSLTKYNLGERSHTHKWQNQALVTLTEGAREGENGPENLDRLTGVR